jgi:hypothetical protein
MEDKDITLKTVIDHVQALGLQVRDVEGRLMKRIDGIDRRLDALDQKIVHVAAPAK